MRLVGSIMLLSAVFVVSSWAFNFPNSSLSRNERRSAVLSAKVADEISRELLKYVRTGVRSERLMQLAAQLGGAHSQKDIFTKSMVHLSERDSFFVCTMCRATVTVVARVLTSPHGELNGPNRDENAKKVILDICDLFDVQTPEVCAGIFDLNWPIVDYILNETIADSRTICGMLPIPFCDVKQAEFKFSLKIKGDLPTESKTDLPVRSPNDHRILHLTDIHYDPEYLEGGLAECREPMCCRDPLPEGSTSTPAGRWSDYRDCDTPRRLIVNAFEHIQKNQKIDWIYHTGDVPPHNIWSTTKQGNLDMLTEIDELLTEYFPEIPIYSCLGNHEAHPTNVFGNDRVPDELSVSWLYDHVWSLWSKWLPSEAESTVRKGGYYTVVPSQGHRIIALNSMDCYLFNLWIFLDGSVVLEQLQWFHNTLLAAEAAGEKVHILSHIPSGDGDCWSTWAREYNRLLERFSGIITGIFNGHTHKDEMNLHYTPEGLAVAISWNGGSLTPFSNKNPNYRIYEVDPDNWQVLEHETWIFNLTAANEGNNEPEWYRLYYFSEAFTVNTSPYGIDQWLLYMAKNPDMLRKFYRFKYSYSEPALDAGCNNHCLSATLCRLATTNYQDKKRCKELQAILKKFLKINQFLGSSVRS
ncbi:sphingomyelin phosphodiesterase-like [Scaptodrosophila lebanonensis]|uniref:Sphingomyelin phosphodiesterase n=1 Tax=Drosophila lebanonensis TaxID=7225 RepID=A0A6J2T2K3_DROLE|nr:sphingomyelin phosphodiesterase-like [Scaptodrosophila lebanonensis]